MLLCVALCCAVGLGYAVVYCLQTMCLLFLFDVLEMLIRE